MTCRAPIFVGLALLGAACGNQFSERSILPGQRRISGRLVPPVPEVLAKEQVGLELAALAIDTRQPSPVIDVEVGPSFATGANAGQPVPFRIALPMDHTYVLVFQEPADGASSIGRLVARILFAKDKSGTLTDLLNGRAAGNTAPLLDADVGTCTMELQQPVDPSVDPALQRVVILGEGASIDPLAINDADGDGVPDFSDPYVGGGNLPNDQNPDANGDGIPDADETFAALQAQGGHPNGVPAIFPP